ncbi:MAG: phosphopentomutase, partial [Hyphomicrobiales bacterium]
MTRAFILVLDSFGIGAAPDAAQFGDEGSDTLSHIAQACADGKADQIGLRAGPLNVPNMNALGLSRAAHLYKGTFPAGLNGAAPETGQWGYAVEKSRGKDTPSGHWEIAGVPVQFDWGYFPKEEPAFPVELTEAIIKTAGLPGILGNKHASGTAVIEEFGAEQMRTGKPIVYTSADSVIQIAAHEEVFGLERLYELCLTTRKLAD